MQEKYRATVKALASEQEKNVTNGQNIQRNENRLMRLTFSSRLRRVVEEINKIDRKIG